MIGKIKLVCFYGPESTGKSTMALRMAGVYKTISVPEVAREIVSSNSFSTDDIVKIGYAQTQRVLDMATAANRILFCDTDLITTQIYSRHYLGVVPPVLYDLEKEIRYDHYFFFDIDTEWVSDGLRDLGGKREEMRKIFLEELTKRDIPFTMLQGTWEEKEKKIREHVDHMLSN